MNEQVVFLVAQEITDPAERGRYAILIPLSSIARSRSRNRMRPPKRLTARRRWGLGSNATENTAKRNPRRNFAMGRADQRRVRLPLGHVESHQSRSLR